MEFKVSVAISWLKSVLKYLMGWINLPKQIESIESKLKAGKPSEFERTCPNCRTSMKVIEAMNTYIWTYRCAPCGQEFPIQVTPIPNHRR
jgi:predicted SprT family Zn-dependent metalloprotease